MRNTSGPEFLSEDKAAKDNSIPCHSRKIPIWLVLLDNIPTLLLFLLGFLIINQVSLTVAIIFGIYALISVVWFWARICPYCPHYDTLSCPCGYGIISPKFFKRKESAMFRMKFRQNIGIQFPNWFFPLAVAIYLLIKDYSFKILIMTLLFSLIGFLIIPVISKQVGCKNCEIKEDCPWMADKKN